MRLIRYFQPTRPSYLPALGLDAEINRLFANALGEPAAPVALPVEFNEDKDNAYVRAELPGIKRDDINIEVTGDRLSITATRKTPASDDQAEETYSLSRTIALPERVQADKIAATYVDGVLTVTLPKSEEAKPRRIALN